MAKDPTNLGDLELALMEYLWGKDACEVKRAYRDVGKPRDITHNTVQSAMKRLWEKGLLVREKEGHAYVYATQIDRRELTELMVGQLVEQVTGSEIEVALQAFVNLADRAGEDTLATLERLVAARRARDEE